MEVKKVIKIEPNEIKKLQNDINNLIEKANHTSDYKKWQELSIEITLKRKELKLIQEFI